MAALTKNAISLGNKNKKSKSETVRDRAKQTKIWDHKGYNK